MNSKKKVCLALCLWLCFIIILPFSFSVKSQSYIVYSAENVNINCQSGQSIGFQHTAIPFVINPFTVTIAVTSGFWNGSNANLKMYESSGSLNFLSNENATITLNSTDSDISLRVNGQPRTAFNLLEAQTVVIEWSSVGWNPVFLVCGLLGLTIFFVTPTYTIYQVKKKKNYVWLFYCLLFFAIGYGLVVVWLK